MAAIESQRSVSALCPRRTLVSGSSLETCLFVRLAHTREEAGTVLSLAHGTVACPTGWP